jgi:signal transduction histidine kinase
MLDDGVANTCLVTNFLHRLGYQNIESINDPLQLFDRMESYQPDLLLLDLAMPQLDGFQVLELLRKAPGRTGHVPVIVVTGDATTANKRRALALGATDLLAKPIDPSEANMRIRNVLERRLLQLEIEEQNRVLEERVAERTRQLRDALHDLQRAQKQMLQQERLSAFAEMAGGVVHDFSNALMAIIGYSDMLIAADGRKLDDRATALEYLGIINTAGRDAAEVVSRLRDYYRPRNNADLFRPLQPNDLVQQAIAMARPKWADRSGGAAAISVHSILTDVPAINGNAAELREALTNLIFNAVDAMPNGGVVQLRTFGDAAAVALEVEDSGIGMSEEVRARCLDPFFTTKGEQGTGLGLPMVFGIITRHQGKLEIDSVPGRGTVFRIRMPAAAPELADAAA